MTAKILVAFYSRGGAVEALAQAVADGAAAEGAEVRVRRARELVGADVMARAGGWLEAAERMNARFEAPTLEDADWADGIVFGAPTRFAAAATELRAYIESLGALWAQGKLYGKAGGVFTSASTTHGGNEATLLSLYPTFAHFGMVIVPPGYGAPVMHRAGAPYGANAVPRAGAPKASEDELEAARFQGRRMAQVARALKAAAARELEAAHA